MGAKVKSLIKEKLPNIVLFINLSVKPPAMLASTMTLIVMRVVSK